ncbi:major facilitator superfamily protein [Hirsutella rhossiliensis]|uniref:Major facilitator superfamily domain-containing protein n=1 Tax=Hirsutella rhossiliensis TaxID=111463 RepID=A0A9P8MR66_9HYPO|nr:major facilitator superfamily domain-containing protein [Hirsutella rhossiliensis]KAH0960323.1 major facilitator superfamily domain-containing protein [Hirsutella rhossiliensis]
MKGPAMPLWRFWLLSLGVCLGLFLSMIDSTIVATSLYTIGAEFRTVDSVNWVALAYTLAYLGCAVTFASFSDVIGRRNAFVVAYVIFFSFSLACGFARNLPQLIAFRAFQGIGGSGLYSLTMIILPEVCPYQLRQYIGSIVGLVIAGSGALGPVLGGLLTHYGSWRWVFWINGPIGFVSLSIFLGTWPKVDQLPAIQRRAGKDFDYAGSFLVIAASVLVVYAFQIAGEVTESVWGNAIFIAPLAAGVVGWIALLTWEHVVETRLDQRFAPAFPISLFRNRAYAAGAASTLFLGYPYLLLIYSFPLRAQVVSGKSALVAGIMLLPMLGTSALGSAISGKVNSKRNFLWETLLVGATLMTLGSGLLTTISGAKDDSKALGFLTFSGLGFGLSTAAATILVTVEAPAREQAAAQGILAQLRVLGGSLGISTSTIFVHAEARKYLTGILTERERVMLGRDGYPLSNEQWEAIHLAYSEAFRKGMVAAAAVSGAAVLLTLGGYRRSRQGFEDQRQAPVQADGSNEAYETGTRERDVAQIA